MAFQPKRFSPLRRPNAETLDQVGQRLDRVQDAFKAVVDPLSTHVGGLGTGASADIGGLSDTPALALASSASAGTSEEASRSDHRHPFPGAYQLRTRQAVTTATTLSGTGDLTVAITASFDGAITLPAATTAGQTITITDEAGVGSGDANGASESLIYLLCAGSDTITAPGLATSRTRLLLWKKYGTITLVADGTSSWKATERAGWHVDPRAISGLELWFDARRGVTLNGTDVSAWADLSGNNKDVSQGTAANQPGFAQQSLLGGLYSANYIFAKDTSDTLTSGAGTVAITSGAMSGVFVVSKNWIPTVNTEIFGTTESATAGLAYFPHLNAAPGVPFGVLTAGDYYFRGQGTGAAGPARGGGAHYGATVNIQRQVVQAFQLRAANSRTWTNYSVDPGPTIANLAVPSFTQTFAFFKTFTGTGVTAFVLYDANLATEDMVDLRVAAIEAFGPLD